MTNTLPTSTNTLQTLANNGKQATNYWPTDRKTQMVWLAMLTAVTLIGQYVLLGTIGLGRDASKLPDEFFIFEKILWGARGLVEIAVVVYVGMTNHKNDKQAANLFRFEALLITLIVLTVGPVWGSLALKVELVQILRWWGVVAWGALLAGISATMLAAVAYAYRVQPTDDGYVVVPFADYEKMLAVVGEAENKASLARQAVDEMLVERDQALAELRGMREAVEVLRLLPASAQVQVVAMFNRDVTADSLAESFGLKPATVRGVFARLNSGK